MLGSKRKDRRVPRIIQRTPGHVGEDLDTTCAKIFHRALRFGNSRINVVHVEGGYEGRKAMGVLATQRGHGIVRNAGEVCGDRSLRDVFDWRVGQRNDLLVAVPNAVHLAETHIEVHKFRSGAIVAATFLALILQAFVPVYIPKFAVLDLPLLITIYFGLSRRNPSTGLLLGMVIGLLQDSLSGPTVPLGLYGIAKTIIGYLASSIGARLDTEHPAARLALTMMFFVVHQGFITLTRRLLLAEPEQWFTLRLAIAAAVNAVVAVLLFAVLDRLRRS